MPPPGTLLLPLAATALTEEAREEEEDGVVSTPPPLCTAVDGVDVAPTGVLEVVVALDVVVVVGGTDDVAA